MQFKNKFYEEFSDYIFKHTGIHYAEANYYQLDARINKLMKFLETSDENDVLKAIQGGAVKDQRVHQMIVDLATNNETYFFRDPGVFNTIKSELVPQWLEKIDQGGRVSVWSCASSSGQEIYSIMMNIEEKRPGAIEKGFEFKATDISNSILEKAKAGVYSQLEAQRGLPILMLTKYFKQTDSSGWQIRENFPSKVNFSNFNLLTGSYPTGQFDLICCRNVLIYQKKENKAMVLEKLYQSLKPGGILLLGNTENTFGLNKDFVGQTIGGVAMFQKPLDENKGAA